MEIVDTVMIGAPPWWLWTILGISIVVCTVCLCCGDDRSDFRIICFVAGFGIGATAFVLLASGTLNVPNHEEYVIKLTDISTTEFIENWEVTKEFEYSDVIQVKKKEKKQ